MLSTLRAPSGSTMTKRREIHQCELFKQIRCKVMPLMSRTLLDKWRIASSWWVRPSESSNNSTQMNTAWRETQVVQRIPIIRQPTSVKKFKHPPKTVRHEMIRTELCNRISFLTTNQHILSWTPSSRTNSLDQHLSNSSSKSIQGSLTSDSLKSWMLTLSCSRTYRQHICSRIYRCRTCRTCRIWDNIMQLLSTRTKSKTSGYMKSSTDHLCWTFILTSSYSVSLLGITRN